jgi:hypothetical protein
MDVYGCLLVSYEWVDIWDGIDDDEEMGIILYGILFLCYLCF